MRQARHISDSRTRPSGLLAAQLPHWIQKRLLSRARTGVFRTCALAATWGPMGTAADTGRPFPLRTHQAIYQNPFDLSSGGASITRTTLEGSMFVNPSLPAFGNGLHRWAFLRTQLHLDAATSETAVRPLLQQNSENPVSPELIQKALTRPIHVGHDTALGYINRYFGIAGFSNVRADVAVRQFGDVGVPQARVRAYGIGGGGVSASFAFGQFLAFGATSKYLEVAQAAENLSIGDIQNPDALSQRVQSALKRGSGFSSDAGATLQLRSQFFDIRLSGTVHDIGNTALGVDLDPFLQTIGAGVGFTLHGRENSVHCAADLRDVLEAYGEHWTFRSYAGCKATYHKVISLGAGLSQGYPTAGVVLKVLFSRLEAGIYTQEVGSQAGIEGRTVYFFAMGTEF